MSPPQIPLLFSHYDYLVETLNHLKYFKLKDNTRQNVSYLCAENLVDDKCLESTRAFKPEHLRYITCIIENIYGTRSHLWATHKYNEVTKFINKLCVCEKYFIRPDDIITYGTLVQEDMCEYRNILDSKRWEPTDSFKKSQDQPLLLKDFTVVIEYSFNKTAEKVDFKIYHNRNDKKSVIELSNNPVVTCYNCDKKGHMKRDYKSN